MFHIPRKLLHSNISVYGTVTITSANAGHIHFYLTWMGDPSNQPAGSAYLPDDLDLKVYSGTGWTNSASQANTTEHVSHPHPGGGASVTYRVDSWIYTRRSNPTSSVFASLVWTFDNLKPGWRSQPCGTSG